MPLDSTQCQTLSTDMQNNTNQTVIDALAAGDNVTLRDWYNGLASPDFWILKSEVPVDDIVAAMEWGTEYATFKDDMEAISFLLSNGTYAPQPPNAREALSAVFAGATVTRSNILVTATRKASNAEKLFAVATTGPGGGDGSAQGTSAIPIVEGDLTLDDIRCAVALIP